MMMMMIFEEDDDEVKKKMMMKLKKMVKLSKLPVVGSKEKRGKLEQTIKGG